MNEQMTADQMLADPELTAGAIALCGRDPLASWNGGIPSLWDRRRCVNQMLQDVAARQKGMVSGAQAVSALGHWVVASDPEDGARLEDNLFRWMRAVGIA